VADERSVDVDEARDQPPEPEDGPPIPDDGGLATPQKAQLKRAAHAKQCRQCADIDRPLCAVGEQLWRDWTKALEDAYDRLHDQTA
jgi:hypothetical protein